MKQTTAPFLLLSLLTLISCGKNNDTGPAAPAPTRVGTITTAEVVKNDKSHTKIYVNSTYHSYNFDMRVDDNNKIIALHNGQSIGKFECLEKRRRRCIHKSLNFNFSDRGVLFTGKVEIEQKVAPLRVLYFEGRNHRRNTRLDYGRAFYSKLTVGNKVTHSISVQDYKRDIRNQTFMKKYSLKNDPNKSLQISMKLPRRTTRDENVYTDSDRNGYRSSQNPGVRTVTYFDEEDIIFTGTEAKNEFDRFFDNDNREVGLVIPGLSDLIY